MSDASSYDQLESSLAAQKKPDHEQHYSAWESTLAKLGTAALSTKKAVERQSTYKPPDPEVGRRTVAFVPADQAALLNAADPAASPSWGARFLAGLKASPEGRMDFLRKQYGQDKVHEIKDSSGGIVNVVIERPGQRPMLLDPAGIGLGDLADLSGNALETLGGVAGAVLAARAGQGKVGAAAIEAGGDLAGSALRQGVSALIPGDDQLTVPQRLAMAGINVAGGQIGNVVQGAASYVGKEAPIPKAIGGKGFLPSTRAQTELGRGFAGEASKESTQTIAGETMAEHSARAKGVSDQFNSALAEGGHTPDFAFTGPQATGSKAAAKAWNVLAQTPEVGDEIIKAERKQADRLGKVVDMYIKKISANPEMLGNSSVGDQLINGLKRNVESKVSTRAAVVGPVFDAANTRLGGKRAIPVFNTIDSIDKLIDEYSVDIGTDSAKAAVAALQKQKADLLGLAEAGQDPKVTVGSLQRSLSIFGKAAASSGDVYKDLDRATNQHIAKTVFAALNRDLDAAAGFVGGEASEAGKLLIQARSMWKEHTAGIEAAVTVPVAKLLKLEGQPTTEAVADKLLGMGKAEIRSVMKLLDETDPAAAQNVLAQALANIAREAGHGIETPGGATMASAQLSPQKLAAIGKTYGEQINALLGGNKKAQFMVRNLFEGADLMAAGPALRGSQTQPNQWTMGALQKAMAGAPRQLVAELQGVAANAVQRGVFSPETMMHLIVTPEGAETLHKLVRLNIAAPSASAEAAKRTAKETIRALTQLTVLAGRGALQGSARQDQPASPYEYAGATP